MRLRFSAPPGHPGGRTSLEKIQKGPEGFPSFLFAVRHRKVAPDEDPARNKSFTIEIHELIVSFATIPARGLSTKKECGAEF
jgi:hypothetical protein